MPSDEIDKGVLLPTLDPFLGYLPPQQEPYRLTWGELHELFVAQAPYRERRERLYAALHLFADAVWDIAPTAKLWVNGGFATHKPWAAPEDVDVVIMTNDLAPEKKKMLVQQGLLTFKDVGLEVESKTMQLDRLRPFGGLVDSYFADSKRELFWRTQWSRVKGPDGQIMPGVKKGFVEVVRGV
jgi:hypothetical protein